MRDVLHNVCTIFSNIEYIQHFFSAQTRTLEEEVEKRKESANVRQISQGGRSLKHFVRLSAARLRALQNSMDFDKVDVAEFQITTFKRKMLENVRVQRS